MKRAIIVFILFRYLGTDFLQISSNDFDEIHNYGFFGSKSQPILVGIIFNKKKMHLLRFYR